MENLRKSEEIIINGVSLKELLKSHQKWLDNKESGKQLILENADLENADLRYADLRYADLENTNLSDVNLENANLENANLESVNLRCAILEGAILSCADLRYADLEGANLIGADLIGANLKNANLRYAGLQSADLQDANLKNADLRYTNLRNTNLEGAKFYLTNLYKVKRDDLFGVSHIGSRYDTTHYFIEDNRIICGCFDNTLENFEEKVKDTYDKNTREYMEYMIAIDAFKKCKEMYYKIK